MVASDTKKYAIHSRQPSIKHPWKNRHTLITTNELISWATELNHMYLDQRKPRLRDVQHLSSGKIKKKKKEEERRKRIKEEEEERGGNGEKRGRRQEEETQAVFFKTFTIITSISDIMSKKDYLFCILASQQSCLTAEQNLALACLSEKTQRSQTTAVPNQWGWDTALARTQGMP